MVYVNPYFGVEGLCPSCGDEGLHWRNDDGTGDVLYCRCGRRCGTEEEMALRVLRRMWLNWEGSRFMRGAIEDVAKCVKEGDMVSYVRFTDAVRRGLFRVGGSSGSGAGGVVG